METRATTAGRRPPRHVRLWGADVRVVGPNRNDPRLRLSAVVVALQLLGQTVLGFKLSIAQIVVSVGVCAAIDVAVTLHRDRLLAVPASAMLTGNSVAFILRASGTRHGDWWSFHGIWYFVLAAVLSLASKYLLRPGGRHIFNPSNVGLVWCLLLIGPNHVFPQYLWWGAFGAPVAAALVVIGLGALWLLRPIQMAPMALSFLLPFATLTAVLAATGGRFYAIWHSGPVTGAAYWADIALSPEVLIFVFFMMSDPQTAPRAPLGRILYGAGTAALAVGLLAFQSTEFGIKLAILSSLTVTCAAARLMEHVQCRRRGAPATPIRFTRDAVVKPVVVAAAVIALAAPLNTLALIHDRQIINIEKGLTTSHNPQ